MLFNLTVNQPLLDFKSTKKYIRLNKLSAKRKIFYPRIDLKREIFVIFLMRNILSSHFTIRICLSTLSQKMYLVESVFFDCNQN